MPIQPRDRRNDYHDTLCDVQEMCVRHRTPFATEMQHAAESLLRLELLAQERGGYPGGAGTPGEALKWLLDQADAPPAR